MEVFNISSNEEIEEEVASGSIAINVDQDSEALAPKTLSPSQEDVDCNLLQEEM